MLAEHLLGPGVEQQEVAGAVGVLRLARLEAGLPERGRLLVAEDPRDRDAGQRRRPRTRRTPRRTTDLGQHRDGDAASRPRSRAPTQRPEIHQHRAARVGDIGDVPPPRPPASTAASCRPSRTPARRSRPARVRRRRCRAASAPSARRSTSPAAGRYAPGSAPCRRRRAELVADRLGTRVLPDDRRRDRLTGRAVPHDGRLALVGDPDRSDVARLPLGPVERTGHDTLRCSPRSRPRRARPSHAGAGAGRARPARPRRAARRDRTGCNGWSWCPGRWRRPPSASGHCASSHSGPQYAERWRCVPLGRRVSRGRLGPARGRRIRRRGHRRRRHRRGRRARCGDPRAVASRWSRPATSRPGRRAARPSCSTAGCAISSSSSSAWCARRCGATAFGV